MDDIFKAISNEKAETICPLWGHKFDLWPAMFVVARELRVVIHSDFVDQYFVHRA